MSWIDAAIIVLGLGIAVAALLHVGPVRGQRGEADRRRPDSPARRAVHYRSSGGVPPWRD